MCIRDSYIVSNGDAANGINQSQFAGRLTYSLSGAEYVVTSGISLVSSGTKSSGGATIESVD